MNVLILGSGAREHAIGWLLRKQNECAEIFIHPGNSGTLVSGFNSFPKERSVTQILEQASLNKIQLVVIGPETFLAQGYADTFRKAGFLVVGPDQVAAKLESSKVFAKEFMQKAGIPTAPSHVFSSSEALKSFSNSHWPWVLKLDGLAAGKGVLVAQTEADVNRFCDKVWNQESFGSGPHQVLCEQFIRGQEISYIGFCDGRSFVPLESATDYKRLCDDNQGPNTGGMGAVSPSPFLNTQLESRIHQDIIKPLLSQMQKMEMNFRGILFIGLMIDSSGAPWVLEFNTRFGDPETQCVLPKLKSSFLSLLLATAKGELHLLENPVWDSRVSLFVVATTPGYPEYPELGGQIQGLERLSPNTQVFFAGLTKKGTQYFTQGGRVLGLGSLAHSASEARKTVYDQMALLHWPGIHYRKDIGIS